MLHKNLFIFDIETITDLEAAANLLGANEDPKMLRQSLIDYHLQLTKGQNSFFRQPFHKVVAISFLECEIEYKSDNTEYYHIKSIRSGADIDAKEEDLIKGFFAHLKKNLSRLVSFNGKTFDVPVLKYRAMLFGIQAKWLYQSGDKWNNYNHRYSLEWHCDLLEALSDFSSSARVKMSEVCALLGFPGKLDVDGSDVEQLYQDGSLQEIRDYCECDVLNTYLIYLRYMHHTGKVTSHDHDRMINDLITYLVSQNKQHFKVFLDAWEQIGIRHINI